MEQYELYHHGVKGMKWGRRKARKTPIEKRTANNKNTSKPKDKLDTYWEKTNKNTTARRAGYGMTVAGTVLKSMGQKQYNQYKNDSTPGRTTVINGMGYAGKALQDLGSMTVIASQIKQVSDFNKYFRD